MSHLNDDAERVVQLDAAERLRFLRQDYFVPYPVADSILTKFESLLDWPTTPRMPNRLLVSDTNNGKTTLVRRFMSSHPAATNPQGDAVSIPVIYVQAPPVPDEKRFYAALLDAIGMVHRRSWGTDEYFYQVRNVLPKAGVKLIIIDEIHHVLAGKTERHRTFRHTIKYLGNELMVPIVAVGTEQALVAIQSDSQIENRFEPLELPHWQCNNEWRRLLATFERRLPLRNPSELSDKLLAELLYLKSEGTIGELTRVLRQASAEAIRGGEERICHAVVDRLQLIPRLSVRSTRCRLWGERKNNAACHACRGYSHTIRSRSWMNFSHLG